MTPKTKDGEPVDPALPDGPTPIVPPEEPVVVALPETPPPPPHQQKRHDKKWDQGEPDFRRASTALYSVEGAIGAHCSTLPPEEWCAVCTAAAELRMALDVVLEDETP